MLEENKMGALSEIVLEGKELSRREVRAFNILEHLTALLKENSPPVFTLKLRGEILVALAVIVRNQVSLLVVDIIAMRERLFSKVHEAVKAPRRKRSRPNRADQEDQRRAENVDVDSLSGTPVERMLRRGTPEKKLNADSSDKSSGTGDRKNQKQAGDNASEISDVELRGVAERLELANVFRASDDSPHLNDYHNLDMNFSYNMPEYNNRGSARLESHSKRMPDESVMDIRFKDILGLSEDMPEGDRDNKTKQKHEDGRGHRKSTKKNLERKAPKIIIDESINMEKKPLQSQEETMEATRFKGTEDRRMNTGDRTRNNDNPFSLLNLSTMDMSNLLKAIDKGDFEHNITLAKEYQKSYFPHRSEMRSPLINSKDREYMRGQNPYDQMLEYPSGSAEKTFQEEMMQMLDSENIYDYGGANVSADWPQEDKPVFNGIEEIRPEREQTEQPRHAPKKASPLSDIEEKVNRVIQKNMVDGKVNFNKLVAKENNSKSLKGLLFYQVLNLGYRLQQDSAESFSDIIVSSD